MPNKEDLKVIIGKNIQDIKSVRLPGVDKKFEQLTISELVQLRPGSNVSDSYEVNAVTDNVSVTTSALLNQLGQLSKRDAINKSILNTKLNTINTKLNAIGHLNEVSSVDEISEMGSSGKSSTPDPDGISLSESSEL